MRFWPHHFTGLLPWFGLLVGVLIDNALSAAHARSTAYAVATGVALLLLGNQFNWRARQFIEERANGGYASARRDPICASIQKHSDVTDSVFVWGFAGDLYVSCRRRPASRYTYANLVAGVVPPFWSDPKPSYVARGAPEAVEGDLRLEKPAVIVDVGIGGHAMTEQGYLAKIVSESYCAPEVVDGYESRHAKIYVRRDLGCGG
jgi:hypothetical protein